MRLPVCFFENVPDSGIWLLATGFWLLVYGSASSKKQAASSQLKPLNGELGNLRTPDFNYPHGRFRPLTAAYP
jgi:hypothetical protein